MNKKTQYLSADRDGLWYYITVVNEDGSERRVVSSNRLAHIQETANNFSTGKRGWKIRLDNVIIINGRTHRAVAFYAKGRGLQEGWQEGPNQALRRQEAYETGQSLIRGPEQAAGPS